MFISNIVNLDEEFKNHLHKSYILEKNMSMYSNDKNFDLEQWKKMICYRQKRIFKKINKKFYVCETLHGYENCNSCHYNFRINALGLKNIMKELQKI